MLVGASSSDNDDGSSGEDTEAGLYAGELDIDAMTTTLAVRGAPSL